MRTDPEDMCLLICRQREKSGFADFGALPYERLEGLIAVLLSEYRINYRIAPGMFIFPFLKLASSESLRWITLTFRARDKNHLPLGWDIARSRHWVLSTDYASPVTSCPWYLACYEC
jgi:hypothetical protein